MRSLAVGCLLLVAGAAPARPVILKSFPDANCGYALPGNDWEWADPKDADNPPFATLGYARNRGGSDFVIWSRPLKPAERVDADAYTRGLRAELRRAEMEKVAGKHLVFKGVPSYQLDLKPKEGQGAARCLMVLADRRLWVLFYQTPKADLGPEADAVFDRFAFIKPPTPMLPVQEGDGEDVADKALGIGEKIGRELHGLGMMAFVLLLLAGAWVWIRIRG